MFTKTNDSITFHSIVNMSYEFWNWFDCFRNSIIRPRIKLQMANSSRFTSSIRARFSKLFNWKLSFNIIVGVSNNFKFSYPEWTRLERWGKGNGKILWASLKIMKVIKNQLKLLLSIFIWSKSKMILHFTWNPGLTSHSITIMRLPVIQQRFQNSVQVSIRGNLVFGTYLT